MKRNYTILALSVLAVVGTVLIAADHIDAPAVEATSADITDFYAFQGANSDNIVFVANVQGLLSPGATGAASFSEGTLVEINIDTSGDNIEDLVIQAIPRNGKMYFFGPVAPSMTGTSSLIMTGATTNTVDITAYGQSAITSSSDGMQFFAGPRDDPFFMDFAKFGEITGGMASGFDDPGTDTFAGTNVMSIVVEVPKALIGQSGTINTWVESKSL